MIGERVDDSSTIDLDKSDNRLAETKISLFFLVTSEMHGQTTNELVQKKKKTFTRHSLLYTEINNNAYDIRNRLTSIDVCSPRERVHYRREKEIQGNVRSRSNCLPIATLNPGVMKKFKNYTVR